MTQQQRESRIAMQTTFILPEPVPQAIREKVYIPEDLSGKTFGCYRVVRFSHEVKPHRRYWTVVCACEKQKILREDLLKLNYASCNKCRTRTLRLRQIRKCSSCLKLLPMGSFAKDIHVVDRHARYCKFCSRQKAAKERARKYSRRDEDIKFPETKKCHQCQVEKPSSEFWRDKSQTDGLCNRCCDCKNVEGRKSYWTKTRAKHLANGRVARYKMTLEDLDVLLKSQNNKCAICKAHFEHRRSFYIDHDHVTNKVRAALCLRCNSGLGMFKESHALMRAAMRYLTKHKTILPKSQQLDML